MNGKEKLLEDLRRYEPCCEQEEKDRELLIRAIETEEDVFERRNEFKHITASAWIVNKKRDRVLMVFHNIYNSWSWLGGHSDGDTDLLSVALRESREESGVRNIRPVSEDIFSVENLTVEGHEKNGRYVSSHLHLNVTYLLEADDEDPLRAKPDENSGARWLTPEEAVEMSTEPWFRKRVYPKLNKKAGARSRADQEKDGK